MKICITLKENVLKFEKLPLERLPITQPCSSANWEQNGYYAAKRFISGPQDFLISHPANFLVDLGKRSSLYTTSTINFA
jgi:hypothetical protein